MKLLKGEHKDLQNVFEENGLRKGEYLLSKKAGWVRILIRGEDIHFAYHHKKSSELVDGRFVFKVQYFVREDHQELEVDDWGEVLERLDKILKKSN